LIVCIAFFYFAIAKALRLAPFGSRKTKLQHDLLEFLFYLEKEKGWIFVQPFKERIMFY